MEPSIITAAKSSLVFAFARKEKTMASAASTAFVNETLKQVPLKFGREFLASVQAVDKRQILDVLARYFVPLFKPESSVLAVACAPGKQAELVEGFKGEGWEVVERSLATPDGHEDDDEEEEDSEMESASGSEEDGHEDGDTDDEMTSATDESEDERR
jgi:hypothetical protein